VEEGVHWQPQRCQLALDKKEKEKEKEKKRGT